MMAAYSFPTLAPEVLFKRSASSRQCPSGESEKYPRLERTASIGVLHGGGKQIHNPCSTSMFVVSSFLSSLLFFCFSCLGRPRRIMTDVADQEV